MMPSDEEQACKAVSKTTTPLFFLGVSIMITCFGMFFVSPLTLIGGVLTMSAVSTFGIGELSPSRVPAKLTYLKNPEGCNCCGGFPRVHISNLFTAAAVFTSAAFLANFIGAVVWIPCDRSWDDYYYDDDYNYYNGYNSWSDDVCREFDFDVIVSLQPTPNITALVTNEEGREYSAAMCIETVENGDLKNTFHELWLEENPTLKDDDNCELFPTSWEATNKFKSFDSYMEFQKQFWNFNYRCVNDFAHLYLRTDKPACHGDDEECSTSKETQEECTYDNWILPYAEDCYEFVAAEYSDIVGCFVTCYFEEEKNGDGKMEVEGLLPMYNLAATGADKFEVTIAKKDNWNYPNYRYNSRKSSGCARPNEDGVFAYTCLVAAIVNGLAFVLNVVNMKRMGRIGCQVPARVAVSGVEMVPLSAMGGAVVRQEQQVTFHPDGYAGMASGVVGQQMVGSAGGQQVQMQMMMQQQAQQQAILGAQIEQQRRQLQRNETQMRLQGALSAVGTPAFHLDGTIADVPQATAILQGAQFDDSKGGPGGL